MTGRPSGTVTFLFSDVEGSTQLLSELGPDRYGIALEKHRGIIRWAIARRAGREVDTQGDSFLIAFRRASDAVQAAEEIQQLRGSMDPALLESEWSAGRSMSMEDAIEMALADGGS